MPPLKYRGIDGTQGAGLVAREGEEWQAEACVIDYGGGSAVSRSASPFPARRATHAENKRTEMYFEVVDWIRRGAAIAHWHRILTECLSLS